MAVTTDSAGAGRRRRADRLLRRLRQRPLDHAVGGRGFGAGGSGRQVAPQPGARASCSASRAVARIAREAASNSSHGRVPPRSVVRAREAERRRSMPLSDSTRPRHSSRRPGAAREVREHAAVRRPEAVHARQRRRRAARGSCVLRRRLGHAPARASQAASADSERRASVDRDPPQHRQRLARRRVPARGRAPRPAARRRPATRGHAAHRLGEGSSAAASSPAQPASPSPAARRSNIKIPSVGL